MSIFSSTSQYNGGYTVYKFQLAGKWSESEKMSCHAILKNLYEPKIGEGKRRNEFAEWHVAWLAEWHNYAEFRVCSFRRIQKRIFDPRFARFRGRKEREIRNWICNLGNLSPTCAICTTASQKMTCFLLFDKLCDYTVQNLVVGSLNSDDGTYKTDKERSALKLKII